MLPNCAPNVWQHFTTRIGSNVIVGRSGLQSAAPRNGLVVDNGGLSRKASRPSSSVSSRVPATGHARDKRFSHDSGLSDGSYVRRRHRPHR